MDSSTLHRLYLFSSESLRPTEWNLDGTMLHYLAVWKSMVSIHRAVHLKLHTLPDKLIAVYPRKMDLKALLSAKVALSLGQIVFLRLVQPSNVKTFCDTAHKKDRTTTRNRLGSRSKNGSIKLNIGDPSGCGKSFHGHSLSALVTRKSTQKFNRPFLTRRHTQSGHEIR